MPRLTSLSGAQVVVLFDDPLGIVEFDEVADGIPQLRDVAVDATMDDLFLQRAIEPLGDAVGLGLGDEGVGRLDAPEPDLVGEVVRQILGAVIHPQGQPVTNNRTRLLSGVAKEAFKLRAEIVERSFAHNLDRGGMRRTWLRGRENVHKRYLLHVAGHNLSLLMRKLIGAGTPREAVAGGYGCICVLIAPAGAVLIAQMVPHRLGGWRNRLRRVMFRRRVKPGQ